MALPQRSPRLRRVLGIAALFSGAALVAHILSGISLRLTLAFSVALLGLGAWSRIRRATPEERAVVTRVAVSGAVAGIAATIVYDVSKLLLSHFDDSPYNPFEAIRVFGRLLAGEGATPAVVVLAGSSFHLLNGIAFGVAFALLFGARGILAGIAWGLFLELFQLTLYPGWLDVRAYAEFARISALGHVAYGAVLGGICRVLLTSPQPTRDV